MFHKNQDSEISVSQALVARTNQRKFNCSHSNRNLEKN